MLANLLTKGLPHNILNKRVADTGLREALYFLNSTAENKVTPIMKIHFHSKIG
jgi:hypothetical protein